MKSINRGLNLLSRLLLVILLLFSGLLLASFIYIALKRMGYPYELEWMEGGTLGHVRRVLEGLPLYVQPSLGFTPFIYTPLYYYISAPFMMLLGEGFTPLRLVSFLSTLGSAGIIFMLVREETRCWVYGALAAGLFAGTFILGGAWFDLARSDSLFLFLLLLSAYLLRQGDGTGSALAAGILMFLSFYSKQTALATGLAMCVYSMVRFKGRARFIFPAVFLTLTTASTLMMNWRSGGWYWYYVFELPNQHMLYKDMLPSILMDDIARPLPVVLIVNGLFFLTPMVIRQWRSLFFYVLLCGSMIGAALLSRMHSGGYINVLIPAYAALAIGFGLGLGVILPAIENNHFRHRRSINSLLLSLVQISALVACTVQYRMLVSDPREQIPTRDDVQAGNALVQRIREIDGEVYIPYHSYLSEKAGKAPTAQGMALEDIFRSRDEVIIDGLKTEIRKEIENRRFAAIILDGEWRFAAEIQSNYEFESNLFDNDVFWTYTGMITRPNLLYMRRGD